MRRVIQVGLDNAEACLASQTPREFTQQLMLGALTLQKMRAPAKVQEKKDGVTTGLEELRDLMEPREFKEA